MQAQVEGKLWLRRPGKDDRFRQSGAKVLIGDIAGHPGTSHRRCLVQRAQAPGVTVRPGWRYQSGVFRAGPDCDDSDGDELLASVGRAAWRNGKPGSPTGRTCSCELAKAPGPARAGHGKLVSEGEEEHQEFLSGPVALTCDEGRDGAGWIWEKPWDRP